MEESGCRERESGQWVKRKHHFLRRYCDIFTKSMRGKWNLVYLDLLAGPGTCRVRGSDEQLPGSPLVALEYPFDRYVFVEKSDADCHALRKRIKDLPKAKLCRIIHGDWVDVVQQKRLGLKNNDLVLAFVDPVGINDVPWRGIEALACHGHLDILMTIQHALGVKRNLAQYTRSKHDRTALDAFLGTTAWRSGMPSQQPDWPLIAQAYKDRMADIGFSTGEWEKVDLPGGAPLYYIALFARLELATRFWRECLKKDEVGQRALSL